MSMFSDNNCRGYMYEINNFGQLVTFPGVNRSEKGYAGLKFPCFFLCPHHWSCTDCNSDLNVRLEKSSIRDSKSITCSLITIDFLLLLHSYTLDGSL